LGQGEGRDGAGTTHPQRIFTVPPRLPAGPFIAGTVEAEATIDEEGCVEALRVLASSNARLEATALDAWRQWVFLPTTVDGKPVKSTYGLALRFGREHAAPREAEGPPFTASVGARQATFIVPVERKGRWDWNRESTEDNANEYQWQVTVRNGADEYSFGFYLWKPPGVRPQAGDLAALLRAGQMSLFHDAQQGSSNLIPGAEIRVEPAGDTLTIRVEGKETVKRLFSSRPEEVTFDIRTPGEAEIKKEVKVTYR
jgi:TonB family protein